MTGAKWRKSSWSSGDGGTCVEVTTDLPDVVAVRDSKNPRGPVLVVTPAGWRTFLRKTKDGWS
nr:DUF397 domain-containing protein [Sphaerisporangium rubeum]